MCSKAWEAEKLELALGSRLTGSTSWPMTILPPGLPAGVAPLGAALLADVAAEELADAADEALPLDGAGVGAPPQAASKEAPKAPAAEASSNVRACRRE